MASIEISEARGVRYLHFGSPWVQGAMRIARPFALELEYTRELMMPLLLRGDAWPRNVLQVGLGAASVTRFLHRHRPEARITVVEIEPKVVAAARQFFKLPEDARVRIAIGDGHDFLAGSHARFDLIVVDGFDEKGRPGMLDSVPFYVNCRERLGPRGMAAFNLLTRHRDAAPALARMREAFGQRLLVLPPTEAGNVVALGAAGERVDEAFDDLRAAAERLKAGTGLNLHPTLARLEQASAGRSGRLVL